MNRGVTRDGNLTSSGFFALSDLVRPVCVHRAVIVPPYSALREQLSIELKELRFVKPLQALCAM